MCVTHNVAGPCALPRDEWVQTVHHPDDGGEDGPARACVYYHSASVPFLRTAALVVHGFQLSPVEGTLAQIWRLLRMVASIP